MENLAPVFRLSLDEQQRRDGARQLMDAEAWKTFTSSCIVGVRRSYEAGEIVVEEAIRGVGRIAIGCWPQDRVQHLGL
jgi:hypothetical protein